MVVTTEPNKSQRRELERWGKLLKLKESGFSVHQLAQLEDVTTTQIYALLAKAKDAKQRGWI